MTVRMISRVKGNIVLVEGEGKERFEIDARDLKIVLVPFTKPVEAMRNPYAPQDNVDISGYGPRDTDQYDYRNT